MSRRAPAPLRAFTLTELLIAIAIVVLLAALAIPSYRRAVEDARSTEAVHNLALIRQAEMTYRTANDAFVEAIDLPMINTVLDVELSARYFDYAVQRTETEGFLIIATSKTATGPDSGPLRVTMDHTGQLTYHRPGLTSTGGGLGGIGGGGGGSSGGGSSGGGSGGGGSGGSSSGGGSGGSSGSDGGSGTVSPSGVGLHPLAFIPRGPDLWTDWPTVNQRNIVGTSEEVARLSAIFDVVASSSTSVITDDLTRRGIELSFGDPTLFVDQGLCGGAIACFVSSTQFRPPTAPGFEPAILFNPAYASEQVGVLAGVLVHEGTHFEQYLDGTLLRHADGELSVVDVEFTAWWNAAAYWAGVRNQFLPADTVVEQTMETGWQKAQEGEAALRDLIASLYH